MFQAPAVLVCQNNHWSISVPTAKQTAAKTLAIKGRAYGVPSVRVDGNDLLAVYTVISDAQPAPARGGGPTFIEAVTYRIGAHSTSDDPTRYRSDAEVSDWKKKDPVDRLQRHLRVSNLLSEADEATQEEALTQEVAAAIKAVEELPPPPRESLFDDVYHTLPWHLEEQRAILAALPPRRPRITAASVSLRSSSLICAILFIGGTLSSAPSAKPLGPHLPRLGPKPKRSSAKAVASSHFQLNRWPHIHP